MSRSRVGLGAALIAVSANDARRPWSEGLRTFADGWERVLGFRPSQSGRGSCSAACMAVTSDSERLTEIVIGCGIEVHRTLGPGLLESVYRECLRVELAAAHLRVDAERHVRISYKGHLVTRGLRIDLLVEDALIVEVKAVETVHSVHLAQVITYLKLTGCRTGLLMNFNATSLRAGLKRLTHPDLYVRKAGSRGAELNPSAPEG